MSFDKFFSKQYHKRNYNCAHFVVEVWNDITGKDITKTFGEFLLPEEARGLPDDIYDNFVKIKEPVSPCIVVMRQPKSVPHVGIFYKNKILQITERGVSYLEPELATRHYRKVRYYKC